MDARRRVVLALLLVAAGAAIWIFVARPLLGPPERERDAQTMQDALTLTQLVRLDLEIAPNPEIDAAWAKRRPLYDAEHLAKLRARLLAFVDFQVGEYADAKNIYLSGRDPAKPSTQALLAQEKLKAEFGADADAMIGQFRDRVREAAYKASPKIGGGVDPDAVKYDALYDDLIAHRLPQARATVERLTAPAR